jgi:hypothetical protein
VAEEGSNMIGSNISPKEKFYGPKLKIERAKQHISDLNLQITKFVKRNPYFLRVEPEPPRNAIELKGDPKRCHLTIRVREELTPCIPLTLGDAIHNLRSALDLLAYDLLRGISGVKENHIKFPFGANQSHFEGAVKNGQICLAGSKVVDVMLSTKAYPGGNDPLYSLHDLDITDKHFEMLEIGSTGLMPTIRGNINIIDCRISPLKDGVVFAAMPTPGNCKFGDEFDVGVEIHFAKGLPFERESIVPTLFQLVKLVEDIVTEFEAIT